MQGQLGEGNTKARGQHPAGDRPVPRTMAWGRDQKLMETTA